MNYQPGAILQPGQMLVNNYRVTRMLGAGGMGQVFAAEDINRSVPVAVKVPALNIITSPHGADSFLHEAQIAARLIRHPHIVKILTCLTDPKLQFQGVSIPFIIMEFLGGGDLTKTLERGILPLDQAFKLFEQMCSAIQYGHSYENAKAGIKGVIHRDLKPQNICFTDEGELVVVDFGLSKVLHDDPSLSGGVLGTPTHMSPEQWSPSRGVDHRTDIYALGVILFEMMTGHLPFMGRSIEEFMHLHLFETPPDPRAYRREIPEGVAQAILRSLAKDKDERFYSADEFAQAVGEGMGIPSHDQINEAVKRPHIPDQSPIRPLSPAPKVPEKDFTMTPNRPKNKQFLENPVGDLFEEAEAPSPSAAQPQPPSKRVQQQSVNIDMGVFAQKKEPDQKEQPAPEAVEQEKKAQKPISDAFLGTSAPDSQDSVEKDEPQTASKSPSRKPSKRTSSHVPNLFMDSDKSKNENEVD
jgi:serine/threonine protein kinase